MIYEAKLSLKSKLLELPETGMGFQIIEGIPEGKNVQQKFVVYNTELVVTLDTNFEYYKRTIIKEGFSTILQKSLFIEMKNVQLVSKSALLELRALSESKKREKSRYSGTGATDNKVEIANGEEIFTRLSAYEDDKRIDFIRKRLKPGSYATTLEDYKTCKAFNDDPIDRYALPNDEEIKWAFHIKPKKFDTFQRGIVQPAFGHDGGGIEAYFQNGTSDNSFIEKTPY